MDSRLALTSFTRDYDYLKLSDIWSSKLHFDKFNRNEFYNCKPTAFFVYSSRFFFKRSESLKNFNLVITLVYEFKPIIIKNIPFNSLITTCSFAKDAFKPILFIGQADGHISILNLDNLDNIQRFKPNFCKNHSIILADWLNENCVLFADSKQLYQWNIETGQINLIFNCTKIETITYFTCSSFSPNLVGKSFKVYLVLFK